LVRTAPRRYWTVLATSAEFCVGATQLNVTLPDAVCVTVTENAGREALLVLSDTLTTIWPYSPRSASVGWPYSLPVDESKFAQLGLFWTSNVRVSPLASLAFGSNSYISSYLVPHAGILAIGDALLPNAPVDIDSSALKHPKSIGPAYRQDDDSHSYPQFRTVGYMPKLHLFKITTRKRRAATDLKRRIAWPRFGLMCRPPGIFYVRSHRPLDAVVRSDLVV
jgi:hypothetical protein